MHSEQMSRSGFTCLLVLRFSDQESWIYWVQGALAIVHEGTIHIEDCPRRSLTIYAPDVTVN